MQIFPKPRSSAATLAVACMVATGPAWAQVAGPQDRATANGEAEGQSRNDFEEIIVEGRRLDPAQVPAGLDALGNRSILDTPVQIFNVDKNLIANLQANSTEAIARRTPSATLRNGDAQIGSNFFIRGFLSSNYYLDGQQSYTDSTLERTAVPVEVFENIQIVSGAAGFLFGFGQPGGVINMTTKKPERDTFARGTITYRESDVLAGHADLNFSSSSGNIGLRVNAVGETGTLKHLKTDIGRVALSATVGVEITPTTQLRVDGLYVDRESTDGTIYAIRTTYNIATLGLPRPFDSAVKLGSSEAGFRSRVKSIGGALIQQLGGDWVARLNVSAASNFQDQYASAPTLSNPDGTYRLNIRNFIYDNTTVGAQILIKGTLQTGGIEHNITLGSGTRRRNSYTFNNGTTDFISLNYAPTGNIYTNILRPAPILTRISASGTPRLFTRQTESSIFASDIIEFSDALQLLLAGRYIWQKDQPFNYLAGTRGTPNPSKVFAPTIGALVKPMPSMTLYASYSKGFQPGYVVPPGSGVNAGAVLKAGVTEQYEAGIKYDAGGALLSAAVFEITQPRLLCLDASGQINTLTCVTNYYGGQRHRGAEASITGRLGRHFNVVGGVLYLDPVITVDPVYKGLRPASVPRFSGKAFVEFLPTGSNDFAIGAGAEYIADSFYDAFNLVTLPGYVTADIAARYTLKVGGTAVTLRAAIDNVFDRKYFYARSTLSPGAPRTAIFSISAGF